MNKRSNNFLGPIFIFGLLLNISLVISSFAQNTVAAQKIFDKQQKWYEKEKWDKWEKGLLLTLEQDSTFAEAHYQLGDLSWKKFELESAFQAYQKAMQYSKDKKKVENLYYLLGKTEMYEGNPKVALDYLTQFLALKPSAKLYYRQIKEAEKLIVSLKRVEREYGDLSPSKNTTKLLPPFNQFTQQYFPSINGSDDFLVFTVRKKAGQEDIYASRKNKEQWSDPQVISEVSSLGNEGTATISADGKVMVFTNCENSSQQNIQGNCDLFISYFQEGKWSVPENLGSVVNSKYWDSQPALSADGRTLIFSSDRVGGKGNKDLWKTTKNFEGEWTHPVNMGARVNTSSDEISPFIHPNQKDIYFSSNRLGGIFGYDFYLINSSLKSTVKHIDYPMNNFKDQVGISITADGKKAYYTEEKRWGALGMESVLVSIDLPEELIDTISAVAIKGKVVSCVSSTPIKASVELVDKTSQEVVFSTQSSNNGEFLLYGVTGGAYELVCSSVNYMLKSENHLMGLEKNVSPLEICLDTLKEGSETELKNIYFESNLHVLAPTSLTELSILKQYLQRYSTLCILIKAHTDNVGEQSYNKELSEKRAASVRTYLVNNGIDPKRINAIGLGEIDPVVVNSTEENREANRRVEFQIMHCE